jgi:hypothetical protein
MEWREYMLHSVYFTINLIAFARNQLLEILINHIHLLVHPIKMLEIRAEPGKKKKRDGQPRRRREDAAGHGVPGGGEAKTSPETGTARLAATLPAEVRLKNLGWGCGGRRSAVVAGVGEDR